MTRPEFVPQRDYYEYVARGYDEAADRYDHVEGRNFLSERVRHATLQAAQKVFRPGATILELGCGTGRDAVTLAQRGFRVVATDVSPAMISLTRTRAEQEGVAEQVSPEVKTAAQAAGLEGPFDGAYSNGAVLNLEPDLSAVAKGLYRSLRPESRVVMTAANRLSLFELLAYPLVLRPRKAFRKLQQTVPIPISREEPGSHYVVPTRFYTPTEFLSHFRPFFDVESWQGLQVITPPWNMVDKATSFYPVIGPLQSIEDRVGGMPGFRSLGAIFLLTLRRKPTK